MINCDHCEKIFPYPCFLEKHLSRKIPCFMKLSRCNTTNDNKSNGIANKDEIQEGVCNIKKEQVCKKEDVCKNSKNRKKYYCDTCTKSFYNKSALEKHSPKCNGCDTLQCPTCFKWFSHRNAKYAHCKNVKCKPPELPVKQQRVFRKVSTSVKIQIGATQSWKCNVCLEQLKSTFQIDHITPLCMGGTNAENNLQALCVECHAQKTQRERQM